MTGENKLPQERLRGRSTSGRNRLGRWTRRALAHWRAILLTILLVAAIGFAGGYYYGVYRPDLQTDSSASHQAVKAASDGAVALLSYSPDTLSRDFNDAKSRVTDDYLAYYLQFAERIVGKSAMEGQVTTAATVVKAAVSEIHPNSAVVVVFLKLKTTSKDKPDPVVTSNSLKVALTKVNDKWLIDKFDALQPLV